MESIRRTAANSPGLAARGRERVRPVPHSSKDRLERYGEDHPPSRRDPHSEGRDGEKAPNKDSAPSSTVPVTSPDGPAPPPVRPAPPGPTPENLEGGVEAIRRLMSATDPKVDLQR